MLAAAILDLVIFSINANISETIRNHCTTYSDLVWTDLCHRVATFFNILMTLWCTRHTTYFRLLFIATWTHDILYKVRGGIVLLKALAASGLDPEL
jgi:hypothetical protein